MPCVTSARIFSSSSRVAGRSTSPITSLRTEPWPMNIAKFGVMRVACTFARNGAERHRRAAVGPFDQRRHALPHVVVGGRHLEDAAPRVRVDVDESGRDDQAFDIDHARRRLGDRRRDADDGVALDGEVGRDTTGWRCRRRCARRGE